MYGQMRGLGCDAEGVVAPGHADQKSWWLQAGLSGESDQAARRVTVGLGGHHEHRVVQHANQPVERFIGHLTIMDQTGALAGYPAGRGLRSATIASTCLRLSTTVDPSGKPRIRSVAIPWSLVRFMQSSMALRRDFASCALST